MSIKLLQQFDLAHYQGITPNEKLVLLVLVTSAEKGNNFSWAGIRLLRQRTKIELPTTIWKALRSLIRKGWIEEAQEMSKGKLRDGYYIFIPTEKMKTYHDFLEVQSDQNAHREQNKMLTHGVSKTLIINSKNRNSKKRNSKKLLASPKENKKGIYNFPIGTKMTTKKFKKKNDNVGKSVEDIVAQQIKEKPIPKKISASYLYDIWEQACKKKAPQYIYISPSGKIIGCLQNILKRVGDNPIEFIQFIVENWYGFGQMARDMDCKSVCLYPSVPYLTQYLDSAILFYGGKQVAKSTTSTGGYHEKSHDSKTHIEEVAPTPQSSSEGHSGGPVIPYLTPEEQKAQLGVEMDKFYKEKAKYLKEKNLD